MSRKYVKYVKRSNRQSPEFKHCGSPAANSFRYQDEPNKPEKKPPSLEKQEGLSEDITCLNSECVDPKAP